MTVIYVRMFEFKFRKTGRIFVRVHSILAKYITENGKSQTANPQSFGIIAAGAGNKKPEPVSKPVPVRIFA